MTAEVRLVGARISAGHAPQLPAIGREQEWKLQGLCSQADPEAWFPDKGGSCKEAKKICAVCPVRNECLQYALENREVWGVWGGLSEFERKQLRKRKP